MEYSLGIIGADAAGLAAAIAAADKNPQRSICVLERNSLPGRKLNATGNGRCNFLNRNACKDTYYSNSPAESAKSLLTSVFESYSVDRMLNRFSELGIVAAEEEEGRLYPRSFQAKSITDALVKGCERRGIHILTDWPVSEIILENGKYAAISESGESVIFDKIILACGGKAGIQYGCMGDGYRFAKAFGHRVIKPIPALTQLLVSGTEDLFGVRVKCRINLMKRSSDRTESFAAGDSGELQFTKDSLSGICTFNVSRFYRIEEGVSYVARLDLFEEYSLEELTELFEKRYERFGFLREVLAGLLPDKLADYILDHFSCSAGELAKVCKLLPFTVTGTKSFKDAQVTSGGIDLSEIDPKTMESTLQPGLFFAGEILDVDAICGGYNLSFAFASGLLAGENA